jgi:hypothetical protein
MIGKIGIAHGCANQHAAVFTRHNLRERQPMDVDHLLRAFDVQFHQVEQRGSARQETRGACLRDAAGLGTHQLGGAPDIVDACELKGFHLCSPPTLCV